MELARAPPLQLPRLVKHFKVRRQQALEARASKEVCPVRAIQDKAQEIAKGEVNTMEIVTPSTTPNVKGTGKSVPQARANTSNSSQEGKNAYSRAKSPDQYCIKKREILNEK